MTLLRRLLLWSVLCVASAAPSFYWARVEYDRAAMALGVALFIVLYTATTSTEAYERFSRRPFVRRTLYIGYLLRFWLSVLFPLGIAVDLYPGMLSVAIVESLGIRRHAFVGTFLTTIVQGTALNILLGLFMLLAYLAQRSTMNPPEPDAERRGFEVVLGTLSEGSATNDVRGGLPETSVGRQL